MFYHDYNFTISVRVGRLFHKLHCRSVNAEVFMHYMSSMRESIGDEGVFFIIDVLEY